MLIIKIHNDGTGNVDVGNYNYSVFVNQEEIASGKVEGHYRAEGWKELVMKMLSDR